MDEVAENRCKQWLFSIGKRDNSSSCIFLFCNKINAVC
jgi:hypothetical protein